MVFLIINLILLNSEERKLFEHLCLIEITSKKSSH